MPEPAPLIGDNMLLLSFRLIEALRLDLLFESYLDLGYGSRVANCLDL